MDDVIISTRKITKRFLGTVALDQVDFDVRPHEIHAIVGENGAGKSTICKILTGIHQPDEGEIWIDGKPVHFHGPSDSIQAGIGMLYQERNLVKFLDSAQNIALGNEPGKCGVISDKRIHQIARELSDKIGIKVPLNTLVSELGAGMQQIVEILRAFYKQPRVLILDEPTASLGMVEIAPFLDFVREIVDTMGISIIFISHKLEEVFRIADRVTVFTDGRSVLTKATHDLTEKECISAMLRKAELPPVTLKHKVIGAGDKPLLSVSSCHYEDKRHDTAFQVYPGEVVGFYGLVGSGRTECFQTLYGMRPADAIDATFDGAPITRPNPGKMIKKGMIMTPERRADAKFTGMTLAQNVCNLFWDVFSKNAFSPIQYKRANEFATQVLQKNGVKYQDLDQSIDDLSGGNIQKLLIGRSIAVTGVKLIVFDEPTNGIDLGAKNEIYRRMRNLVEADGLGVVFISSELNELLLTCDRLYVFADGDVVKKFDRDEMVYEDILKAAIQGGKS